MAAANAEMARHWNEISGPKWVALQAVIDRQIAPLGERAIACAALRPGDRVLDVGCGCGATTLAAARQVGEAGFVLGLDLSLPMLERARQRAAEEGITNVRFVQVDAQTAELPREFDALVSRFGVMFFDQPEAAFANLRRMLRAGARVSFVCWQALARNPWLLLPMQAVASVVPLPPPPPPEAPGPFAFADAGRVRGILEAAGFVEVAAESHEQDLLVGPGDLDGAVGFLLAIGPAGAALREASDPEVSAARAAQRVRAALEPHLTPNGVVMASASWIVTARAPAP